jgi:ATP-dependent RNA helicase DHX37/DHR1
MEEIRKLQVQIQNIVRSNFPDVNLPVGAKLKPPKDVQIKVLRQLLAAAFIDQIAVRKDKVRDSATSGTKYASCKGVAYRALTLEEDVFIHPSSVIANSPPPDYIVYHDIVRTSRLYLKGTKSSLT